MSVRTLEVVEDVGLKAAVTPVGMPDAVIATVPVKGLTSVTVIVSVPLAPGATDSVAADDFSVKPPVGEVTVSATVVVAVRVPEVPVIVTVEVPAAAVLLAVSVRTLEVADDVGLKDAVTPVGNPDAAKDTLPVNGLMSVTEIVSVPLEPATTDNAVADGLSVKPPVGEVTVSAIVVVAVRVPEVPVIVTVEVPAAAVLLAVSVRTLEVVEDVGLNDAVTPLGKPDAANVTLPVKGLTFVTVIVSVPLEPARTDRAVADGFNVKEPVPETTLSVNGTVAVLLPEVPVTVTVKAPVVAVVLAVKVRTLEVVEDAGLNEAVTPLGRPDAVNDTVPVNPPMSVTEMVLVPLVP